MVVTISRVLLGVACGVFLLAMGAASGEPLGIPVTPDTLVAGWAGADRGRLGGALSHHAE